jgi:hypothetical protein
MLAVCESMNWQRKLKEIALAGGAVALSGCAMPGGGSPIPCGNANPDPCICGRPEASPQAKMQCDEKMACEAKGWVWDPFPPPDIADAGVGGPYCHPPQDGGVPDAAASQDGGTPDAH